MASSHGNALYITGPFSVRQSSDLFPGVSRNKLVNKHAGLKYFLCCWLNLPVEQKVADDFRRLHAYVTLLKSQVRFVAYIPDTIASSPAHSVVRGLRIHATAQKF